MIKVKNEKATLKGTPINLCTELTITTRGIIESFEKNGMPREIVVDLVRKAFELSLKTEEELHAEAMKKVGELLMKVGGNMIDDSMNDEKEGVKADE